MKLRKMDSTWRVVIRSPKAMGWHTVDTRTFAPILWGYIQRGGPVSITLEERNR